MTDYAKSVFSNRELLEQKLAIYLDDANDAKKLAPTFEKFFKAGGGVRLNLSLLGLGGGFLPLGFYLDTSFILIFQ